MKNKAVSGIMLTLLLIGMLTLAFNIQPVKAEPTTWTVDDDEPADFSSIQEAINSPQVADGDILFVYNGTYYENVVVNKTVSLIGENKENTIIDGNDTLPCPIVKIVAVNVSISEFTIQNARFTWPTFWKGGIEIYSNGSTISNNIIRNNTNNIIVGGSWNNITSNAISNAYYQGIEVIRGSSIINNTISNNTVVSNGRTGIAAALGCISGNFIANNLGGIYAYGWSTIVCNEVVNNTDTGIVIGKLNTVANNTVTNSKWGIMLDGFKNTLRNNTMTNNLYNFGYDPWYVTENWPLNVFMNDVDTSNTVNGKPIYYWINQSHRQVPSDVGYLALISGKNITVEDLTLTNNQQGVLLVNSTSCLLENLTIQNNYHGVFLLSSSNSTMRNNEVTLNSLGIYVMTGPIGPSRFNIIYHNNFMFNDYYQAFIKGLESVQNVWFNHYPYGGNYWSDYNGTDLYSGFYQNETGADGIGDSPYFIPVRVDGEITPYPADLYPLMEPWTPLPRTISDLKIEIEELGSEDEIDKQGIVRSLIAKLNVAQKLVDKGKIEEAKSILEDAFITQVENLSGIHITPVTADILIKSAEHIMSYL